MLNIFADDSFLLTIENCSGHMIQVKVCDIGHYSSLNNFSLSAKNVNLQDSESLELSVTSKAINENIQFADIIKIVSGDKKYTDLVIEPASLNYDLVRIDKNDLEARLQLRDYGVGYKVIIPNITDKNRRVSLNHTGKLKRFFRYLFGQS